MRTRQQKKKSGAVRILVWPDGVRQVVDNAYIIKCLPGRQPTISAPLLDDLTIEDARRVSREFYEVAEIAARLLSQERAALFVAPIKEQ